MGLKSDRWIREMALKGMIEPFVDHLVTGGVISYGLSSYGYDMRIANEFKVFTGSYSKENAIVDPKNFDKDLLQDYVGDFVIIPPNSYVLGRSVEYFRIPRNVHCIVLGKSTYARSGIIVNITPLEACYDEDTEILTSEGWKKFKDLKDDEIVATLNPNTNELEYQKIVKKQKFEHHGDLIHIKNRVIDLLVTPKHRLFVKNRYREKFEFIDAEKLYGKYNYEMKRDFIWKGNDVETFKIPIVMNERFEDFENTVNLIIEALKEKDLTTIEINEKLNDISHERVRYALDFLEKEKVVVKKAIYLKGKRHYGANKNNQWTLVKKDYVCRKSQIDIPPIKIDLWLKFLGFWLAEGSAYISKKGDYTVKVANFDKEILSEVETWLKEMPFNYLKTDTGLSIISKPLCLYLMQFGHARDKYVPDFVKSLSPNLIKQFLYGFMLGDGNLETETLSTSSKKLADDLQELIFKSGWASIVREIKIKPHKVKDRIVKSNGVGFRIRISKKMLTPKIHPHSFEKVKYDGFVYDVTVPNHTLFVRRKGKAVWSSNSWEGHVTIEISNATPLPVKVYANEGIAQVLFFEGDEPCETSYADRHGKYQSQKGIVLPKVVNDEGK